MRRLTSMLAVSLAIVTFLFLGAASTASADILVYDDFNGSSLSPTLWAPWTNGNGWQTVADSVLTMGSPDDSSDSGALSTGAWGYNTFRFTIAGTFGDGRSGFGINGGDEYATIRTDLGGYGNSNWKFHVSAAGNTYTSDVLAAPVAGDIYDIVWKADAVELWKNGGMVLTESSAVPTTTVLKNFQFFNYAAGAQAAFESVGVSIPEPSSFIVVISGAVGLLCYAWRKRK